MLNNNPNLRIFLSAVLGFAGGNSLTTSVYPFATKVLFNTASFDLAELFRLALPVAAIWTLGGALVGWRRGIATGVSTIAACGLFGGVLLGIYSFGMSGSWWIGPLVGTVYGAIGGLILGAVFKK